MKGNKVNVLLFLALLVMTVMPLTAAFYFLDTVLKASLDLGFNPDVVAVLDQGAANLKTLRRLDPAAQDGYRRQFERFAELRHIYANPALVKDTLLGSLKVYFGIGVALALLASIIVASLLGRKIARTYAITFQELTGHREKVRYLEEISAWQELARMLAHEIKNPLTPIEVLITSLSKSHAKQSREQFAEQLQQAQGMIGEELDHLKAIVDRFGEFAQLPRVKRAWTSLPELLSQHVKALTSGFPTAQVRLVMIDMPSELLVYIDAPLFRQVLTNIVRNGVEANPDRQVAFTVHAASLASGVRINVSNNGKPVAEEIAARMFDPYVSSKTPRQSGEQRTGHNVGLGLAIVKKIVIEHGGEITYLCEHGQPVFSIFLPPVN